MRPLIVITSLGAGGAERSTADFLDYARRRGMSPTVACLYRREGVHDEVVRNGLDVRILSGRGLAAKSRSLRSLIAELKPDLVHTAIFEADVIGRIAAISGPPVLSSLVNASYDPIRLQDPNIRRWRLEVTRIVEALMARILTTHFHAVSSAVKRSAVTQLRLPEERITVIERGRDPRKLGQRSLERRSRVRHALGIADEAPVLLNVGRQEFQKGQKYLLLALRRIILDHPETVLLLAGREGLSSPDLDHVLNESGIAGHVRILGHRDDVPDLLAAADLFVFPSLYEGIGGAVIEAMGLSLPIVGSDLPALRELIHDGQNGILVPIQSPQELADAIVHLLDDPGHAQALGTRGREIFLERFTAEHAHDRLAGLYEKIAGCGRTARIKA